MSASFTVEFSQDPLPSTSPSCWTPSPLKLWALVWAPTYCLHRACMGLFWKGVGLGSLCCFNENVPGLQASGDTVASFCFPHFKGEPRQVKWVLSTSLYFVNTGGYWSGLLCPHPGDLPNPGIQPFSQASPALAIGFLTTSATCSCWNIVSGFWF